MLDSITNWDGNLLISIQHWAVHDSWTPVVKGITSLGNGGIFWITLLVILLCFKKTRRPALIAATALIISFIINNLVLKNLAARTRPYEVFDQVQRLIAKPSDYSFPSGHSAASFVTAVALFRELPKKYGSPLLALAAMIALSRLYLGVHYPTDVFFGALNGTLIALAVCHFYDKKGVLDHGEHRK